jgi:hypothetical protein
MVMMMARCGYPPHNPEGVDCYRLSRDAMVAVIQPLSGLRSGWIAEYHGLHPWLFILKPFGLPPSSKYHGLHPWLLILKPFGLPPYIKKFFFLLILFSFLSSVAVSIAFHPMF